ncbi:hypothetical protein LPJ53_005552 [Coemansia erecta]|uniref:Fat storage-inducing transmembrane protein n=1 Tax=Coemansia erecta TaxID=147472 RepID=A0A9W8CNP4_9FUNG|nr:hypothetical protein LPJ53_005552 [Coemansia erecta]
MPPSARRLRPAILVLAALLAAIVLGFTHSRSAPLTTLQAQRQAQLHPPPPSPWASKRNPLNTYFVKLGWAWTTALLAAALPVRRRRDRAATAARYALATLYWWLLTQWCFGPPLFDRLFVRTGGACHAPEGRPLLHASQHTCRAAGGSWAGGHDVSGHCFLLLHSALLLAEEVLVPLLRPGRLPPQQQQQQQPSSPLASLRRAVVAATAGLVAVWAAMLFFTAKYFHGAEELASGSVLGVAFWGAVYMW